jgi:thymidine kinase
MPFFCLFPPFVQEFADTLTYMAMMIPPEFPNSQSRGIDAKAGDLAELQVFEALKKLDSQFVCIHGYRLKTREVDFLVLHPKLPMIFIEIKGGLFIQQNNSYFSQNRKTGELHPISPIEQLFKAKEELFAELSQALRIHQISWSFKVIFPSCVRPSETLTGQLSDKAIFGAEIHALAFQFSSLMQFPPLGDEAHLSLKNYFNRSIKSTAYELIESALKSEERINSTGRELVEDRLGSILENQRFVVRGPAGSGKTLLLTTLAERLASENKKVLVTCYNELLEKHLGEIFKDTPNIKVRNFHNLCREYVKKSPIDLEMGKTETRMLADKKASEFYADWLPNKMLESIENLKSCNQLETFDALLVDEAQDLKDYWLLCVKELVNENGRIGIFTDPLQDLTKEREAKEALLDAGSAIIKLRTNLRNTKNICRFASQSYEKAALDLQQKVEPLKSPELYPEGLTPTIHLSSSEKGIKEQLAKVLHDLVIEDQIPLSKITILINRSLEKILEKSDALLCRGALVGPYRLSEEANDAKKHIQLETSRRFKGRENVVIISLELDKMENRLSYVTYSRALARLYILRISN